MEPTSASQAWLMQAASESATATLFEAVVKAAEADKGIPTLNLFGFYRRLFERCKLEGVSVPYIPGNAVLNGSDAFRLAARNSEVGF